MAKLHKTTPGADTEPCGIIRISNHFGPYFWSGHSGPFWFRTPSAPLKRDLLPPVPFPGEKRTWWCRLAEDPSSESWVKKEKRKTIYTCNEANLVCTNRREKLIVHQEQCSYLFSKILHIQCQLQADLTVVWWPCIDAYSAGGGGFPCLFQPF